MNKPEGNNVQQGRLVSVDALRSFTMFCIIGGGFSYITCTGIKYS